MKCLIKNCKLARKIHQNGIRSFCVIHTSVFRRLGGRDRFREIVRLRDNNTCRNCGKVKQEGGRRFDVHHTNGLCGKLTRTFESVKKSTRYVITLCHKCHMGLHENRVKKGSPRKLTDGVKSSISFLTEQGLSIDRIAWKLKLTYPIVQRFLALK